MPKPGMTRSEELVYHGFGSTGGAILSSFGDMLTTFVASIVIGFVIIVLPAFVVMNLLNSWGIVSTASIESFVKGASSILETAVTSFSNAIMNLFSRLLGFKGG
ncbi:MAG: hypothetical protein QXP84_07370 [Candidatus Korarchaeum sp.]